MQLTTLHLVRLSSTRLPMKALMNIGEFTVIEHSILRALNFKIKPIICTSINKEDDIFEEIAKKHKISFFRGSLMNKLKRIIDCANFYNLKYFHVVDVDDPYFDHIQIKKSIQLLIKNKLGVVKPSDKSSSGLASVGYSYDLDFLNRNINFHETDKVEMLDSFFNKKKLKKSIGKAQDISYFNIKARLTLDYIEDLNFFNCLNFIVGNFATRKKVEKILYENNDIPKINYFRNQEWSLRQKKIKINEAKLISI